mmetsp:Transcript_6428/g.15950  ORF Transcript_6428/g.15950 Transcript_6428/m.15950 type:complete len:273 (-) Transcript_6428:115-933(-)
MLASDDAGVPDQVPPEVLRYLAGLDDASAAALLARARETRREDAAEQRGTTTAKASLCHLGSCSCCSRVEEKAHSSQVDRLEDADPCNYITTEERIAAAEALTHNLQSGDFASAESVWRRADLQHVCESGWTALHWAVHVAGSALAGRNDRGAEEEAAADGFLGGDAEDLGCSCCRMEPAKMESRELLRKMLASSEGRAAVNIRSADGATPLMFAADAGDHEFCELLIALGAETDVVDDDGDTAEAWAKAGGHSELAKWLLQARGCGELDEM